LWRWLETGETSPAIDLSPVDRDAVQRFLEGVSDTLEIEPQAEGRRVSLPGYPFAGRTHWIQPVHTLAVSQSPSVEKSQEFAAPDSSAHSPEVHYFVPKWIQVPYRSAHGQTFRKGLLVCDQTSSVVDLLALTLRNTGTEVSTLSLQAASALEPLGGAPDLVFLLSSSSGPDLLSGIDPWLVAIQALQRIAREPVRIIHVWTSGDLPAAALAGLLKTLEREQPVFSCTSLCLEAGWSNEQAVRRIVAEAGSLPRETDVVYRSEQRSVRRMEYWRPTEFRPPFREGGTCLIAGAPKGIGGLFARHLALTCRANLMLAGRSAPAAVADSLEQLRALGAQVAYTQTNLTDEESVRHLVLETRKRFGALHGVIHSAGVLQDGPIRTKSSTAMHAVLGPKILGASWLDEATRHDALDFFVLSSSAVALLGNPLQSDHVMANVFLDAFAQAREERRVRGERSGITVSVNWPLWAEGGTKVPLSLRREMAERTGLRELSTSEGLRAFEVALASGRSQILVVSGSEERARALFAQPSEQDESVLQGSRMEMTIDLSAAERKLGCLIAGVIQVPEQSIEPERSFADYGFDSISLGHLHGELEKLFGELPRTTMLEYTSIRDLIAFLARERAEDLRAFAGGLDAAPSAAKHAEPFQEAAALPEPLRSVPGSSFLSEPIAIVGVAGRFPGADSPDQFWTNLSRGVSSISDVPAERW
jgi:NAD(P)-dependent dehydrogenase (short-subunit alcohol dehydrogenase family)/acyl carrier protein